MKAHIVIDLGYGDCGKGITTDFLCSQYDDSIVVRFSGGQQATHTVIHDGKKHAHSSFGSGTLRGKPSYFTEHCTMYLSNLWEELKVLQIKGAKPELFIHPKALVTTPYDIAYNRVREARLNHGSVGYGISATMKRHHESGYKLFVEDLQHPKVFLEKSAAIKLYYEVLVANQGYSTAEYREEAKAQEEVFYRYYMQPLPFTVAGYDVLRDYYHLIFEGSQGILLDMDHGFFPNVTYAYTTSRNAMEVLKKGLPILDTELYYVTRCYQNRHGNGWMSNQDKITLINNKDEINKYNLYQGNFRIGELDYDLLNYAISIDKLYSSRHPKNLVITCLDQRPGFEFELGKLDLGFRAELRKVYKSFGPVTTDVKEDALFEQEQFS